MSLGQLLNSFINKRMQYGILFILIILFYFIIIRESPVRLKFIKVPNSLKSTITSNPENIVILYGKDICPSCPIGIFLSKISENKHSIFFVPESFTNNDIENLIYTFKLRGKVMRGNTEIFEYYKEISKYLKNPDFKKNINIKTKNKKIATFVTY